MVGEAASTVLINPIPSTLTIAQKAQWWIVNAGISKESFVNGVISHTGVVRSHVNGVSSNWYWLSKVDLLPACSGFVGKGGCCQSLPATCPEVANVRPGIATALVEADARDVAVDI